MAKLRSTLYLLTFVLASPISEAAPRPSSIKSYKSKVQKNEKKIVRLRKKISSIEWQLGLNNKNYLEVLENKKNIDAAIYEAKVALQTRENELTQKYHEAKKVLTSTVVNTLDDEVDSATLLSRKILIKTLTQKVKSLKALIDGNKSKQQEIDTLVIRYNKSLDKERQLLDVLNDMEVRKKSLANKYLEAVNKRDKLKTRISKLRSQRIAKSKKVVSSTPLVKMKFASPIEEYLGLEYNKKGITYKFQKRQPVVATRTGKVAYIGSLSNYGKVVMIDHGSETMSVIFGQFNPKVKKGLAVNSGDVLGYTNSRFAAGSANGQLYFEVRKKNKAQNTIFLMKKDFLAKNKIGNLKS